MFLYINYLVLVCYGFFIRVKIDLNNNLVFLTLADCVHIIPVLIFLKNHSKFLFLSLVDITAVDLLSSNLLYSKKKKDRFALVYILLSHYFNTKIIINYFLDDENAGVQSSSKIYQASSWLEREVWDMFGIFFINHPDLRRILTDYGFDGFPLRKDFPITGYIEVRYDDTQKCLVYEPLELSQEYRIFDTLSPWAFVL